MGENSDSIDKGPGVDRRTISDPEPGARGANPLPDPGMAPDECLINMSFDPVAPLRAGPFVIGYVDHVNGPSSATKAFEISRYEASLLALHWLEREEEIERFQVATAQVGSSDMRQLAYTWTRLGALKESGLLTKEEWDQIHQEVYQKHKAFWDAYEASGHRRGFALDGEWPGRGR